MPQAGLWGKLQKNIENQCTKTGLRQESCGQFLIFHKFKKSSSQKGVFDTALLSILHETC